MKVTPLDLRQAKLRVVMRGYDRNEVDALLNEVADDYEQALRESDRLHQELLRLEAVVTEHREHERNLRNTLLTAQRLSDEIREHAEQESRRIVEDAESRAELVLQKTRAGSRRSSGRSTGSSSSGATWRRRCSRPSRRCETRCEFVREQDQKERDDKILLHRPRQVVPEPPAQVAPQAQAVGGSPPARDASARRGRRGIVLVTADFVIRRTRQVVTCAGPAPRRGAAQADVSPIPNGMVASRPRTHRLRRKRGRLRCGRAAQLPMPSVVDAGGGTVLPGFVDPHTHVVYAGDRREELRRRLAGATYAEIAAAGGGILSTVRATREASEDALVESAARPAGRDAAVRDDDGGSQERLRAGDGRRAEDAARHQAARPDAADRPGRHIPRGPRDPDGIPRPPRRLHRPVIAEMIPAVAAERLADWCDVFCETGVYTPEESRAILGAGVEGRSAASHSRRRTGGQRRV